MIAYTIPTLVGRAPRVRAGLRRPRIGVDFHVFDGKYQGSRSHLLGLYGEMIRRCPDLQFCFFLESVEELGRMPGFDGPNVERIAMAQRGSAMRLLIQLPLLSRRHRIDLLHTQYIAPPLMRGRQACTVHDILFEPHPELFTRAFVWRSRLLIRRSARRADLLMTVSEYSRSELSDRYGIPAQTIVVTPNAIDHSAFHPGRHEVRPVVARGLAPGRYILTVGRIEPRKNHAGLLRAYRSLAGTVPPLVIVGQRDFGYGAFERELAKMPPDRPVHLIADATDAELPALYRHAALFVYPTLAEGFGMPPLEAMACGTPVIATRTTALPEVVGDAALLVAPGDDGALRAAMQGLLDRPDEARRLAARGPEQAARFTWRRSAADYAARLRRHLAPA